MQTLCLMMKFWTREILRPESTPIASMARLNYLCVGTMLSGGHPVQCQGSSENSTARDQVTASSPNLHPIRTSDEPDTRGPHSRCLTTTDTATVTSLGLSSIKALPRSDSETAGDNNKYWPRLSLQPIKRACRPDCQYDTKPSVLPISLLQPVVFAVKNG